MLPLPAPDKRMDKIMSQLKEDELREFSCTVCRIVSLKDDNDQSRQDYDQSRQDYDQSRQDNDQSRQDYDQSRQNYD